MPERRREKQNEAKIFHNKFEKTPFLNTSKTEQLAAALPVILEGKG